MSSKKSCFVIAPIGTPESPVRRHSDQVLRHIIRPAVEPLDYRAVRADEIAEPGVITSQIMQRVIGDDLVVADLTGLNPNVLYELAVRHAILKPFVQIINQGETIPFDVSGIRTVFFDLQDPDSVADAKDEIAKQIETLETDSSNLQTPISIPLELQRIRQSGDNETPGFPEILPVISDIASTATANRSDIQYIREAIGAGRYQNFGVNTRTLDTNRQIIQFAIGSNHPYAFLILISTFRANEPWAYELCMEAYRQVMDGNAQEARSIFQFLQQTVMTFPFLPMPGGIREFMSELNALFERLVNFAQSVGRY